MDSRANYLILPTDIDRLVESKVLQLEIASIGHGREWISHHQTMEKLNLQAHQSAQQNQDNFVLESLLTYTKYPVVLHNLLAVETWKHLIYPHLHCKHSEQAALRLYFIIYHEATLSNLLELAAHHSHILTTFEDEQLIELVDYCVRKLTWILGLSPKTLLSQTTFHKSGHELQNMLQKAEPNQELSRQYTEMEFRIAVQCLTILRYICEQLHSLPLSIVSRLLDKHDVLLTLVALVENPPWTYRACDSSGKTIFWKKYAHQTWNFVQTSDLLLLTPTEAQVWIAIYYLLSTATSRSHYEITSFRKGQLLRVKKYLNEVLLDQLPVLRDIQRFLEELTLMQVSSVSTCGNLILEIIPRFRENMLQTTRTHAKEIAIAFDAMSPQLQRETDLFELSEIYQWEGMNELLERPEEPEIQEHVTMQPQSVVLVISREEPIIAELENVFQAFSIEYDVLLDQMQKIQASSSYLRYPLRYKKTRETSIPGNVSLHVRVHFASSTERSLQKTVDLKCDDLQLPKLTNKPYKVWKQIGFLESNNASIFQYQVKAQANSKEYTLGSAFLCVPL